MQRYSLATFSFSFCLQGGEIVAPFLITEDPIFFTFHDANSYFCLLGQFQWQTGGAAPLIFLIF